MRTGLIACRPARQRVATLLVILGLAGRHDIALAFQVERLDEGILGRARATRDKASLSPAERKTDAEIRRGLSPEASPMGLTPARGVGSFAKPWQQNGRLHVEVQVVGAPDASVAALQTAGLEIEIVNEGFNVVQGWINEGAVASLAELLAVQTIRPVYPNVSNAGSVTTEGDRAARADMVRALGYDGRGVVVGVISDGIDDLARSQVSGDLPAVNVPSDPRCRRGSGDEGTAMLEIV